DDEPRRRPGGLHHPGQGGQDRAERALPLWVRAQVQEVPRRHRVAPGLRLPHAKRPARGPAVRTLALVQGSGLYWNCPPPPTCWTCPPPPTCAVWEVPTFFAGPGVAFPELRVSVSVRVAAIASAITRAKTCHIRM